MDYDKLMSEIILKRARGRIYLARHFAQEISKGRTHWPHNTTVGEES
jgi:hypothetical protein